MKRISKAGEQKARQNINFLGTNNRNFQLKNKKNSFQGNKTRIRMLSMIIKIEMLPFYKPPTDQH